MLVNDGGRESFTPPAHHFLKPPLRCPSNLLSPDNYWRKTSYQLTSRVLHFTTTTSSLTPGLLRPFSSPRGYSILHSYHSSALPSASAGYERLRLHKRSWDFNLELHHLLPQGISVPYSVQSYKLSIYVLMFRLPIFYYKIFKHAENGKNCILLFIHLLMPGLTFCYVCFIMYLFIYLPLYPSILNLVFKFVLNSVFFISFRTNFPSP